MSDIDDMEEKKPRRKKGERIVRAHSFSLDPKLYKMFQTDCKERGVNMSAWLRRAMIRQIKEWRYGEHDEYLNGEDD